MPSVRAEAPLDVALLEDQPEMRAFLERAINSTPGLRCVHAMGSLAQARAWFAGHAADVLVTDLGLPDGHAIDLIRALGHSHPQCEVLVVSVFGDENTVLDCIEAGALGYVHKDASPADIGQTILDLRQGGSHISPMIARKLLKRWRQTGPGPDTGATAQAATGEPPCADAPAATTGTADAGPQTMPAWQQVQLSPREHEILDLIARGYAYAEIAKLFGLTVHTVQWHIKNLYSKLAVHSRSEAVFEASRLGLLRS